MLPKTTTTQSCVLPEDRPSLTSLPTHTHLGLEVTLPQLRLP